MKKIKLVGLLSAATLATAVMGTVSPVMAQTGNEQNPDVSPIVNPTPVTPEGPGLSSPGSGGSSTPEQDGPAVCTFNTANFAVDMDANEVSGFSDFETETIVSTLTTGEGTWTYDAASGRIVFAQDASVTEGQAWETFVYTDTNGIE